MRKAILVLAFLLLVPAFALAQSAKDSWGNLKQLRAGQKIEVVDTSMKSLRGPFVSVSEEAISLWVDKNEESVARAKVVRVSVRDTSHRTRNMLIGLAVGAGAGVVVGVASPELGQGKCAQGSCTNAASAALGGFVGAAVGTGLGAVLPTGGWHDVYRAGTKP